jgi:hypothetical protein
LRSQAHALEQSWNEKNEKLLIMHDERSRTMAAEHHEALETKGAELARKAKVVNFSTTKND